MWNTSFPKAFSNGKDAVVTFFMLPNSHCRLSSGLFPTSCVHWPFLTAAKPPSHSLLLPVCYNLVAPTALSCKTGGQARIALTNNSPISYKSAFLVLLKMDWKLWHHLSTRLPWFNSALWKHSAGSTQRWHTHTPEQPAGHAASVEAVPALQHPTAVNKDTTDYPRGRPQASAEFQYWFFCHTSQKTSLT